MNVETLVSRLSLF